VQMQVKIAYRKDGGNEEDAHYPHQIVRATLLGHIEWQVVRSHRMNLIAQFDPPSRSGPTVRKR
jgi:hypothetical protein